MITENNSPFFATSLKGLDEALGGGIPFSSITELVGPTRSGKTQFCLVLSILTTLPETMGGLGGGVCYIDTERSFNADRLIVIAENRFPQYFVKDEQGQANLDKMTSSIHKMDITSSKELIKRLDELQEFIIENDIKLLIVDSIGSLVRKEYQNPVKKCGWGGPLVERNDVLLQQASKLKYLAESFHIPVVVTNQVITRNQSETVLPRECSRPIKKSREEGPEITAALGNTWAHSVTTRIMMNKFHIRNLSNLKFTTLNDLFPPNLQELTIIKSPIAANITIYYTIENEGIVEFISSENTEEDKQQEEEIDTEATQNQPLNKKKRKSDVAEWFISALWA
ncbi:P-loop containing nucleoside triphosphate hydrolase protein [Glomus cerebriforme]|uniref:P-loop containing nucleoside triphosphate hydrolase protein n=1 Tax=Glomus cerebriforme TaxID=658196 RepID=A0A397T1S5_9GLOM|nr:P-loop containing nucleoside triphosphate hydrolase protein [Glomus cerebriforme]